MNIVELNQNELKALEFVANEEAREEEIIFLEKMLKSIDSRLKELNANLQYGYGGNWYNIYSIEPHDTCYSGYINELRIHKNTNVFSI